MADLDVLVVGAGPTGLAAAIRARESGLAVAVVEPRADPVDKACGEGLFPGALARVRALGIDPAGTALSGIRYLSTDQRSVRHDWRAGPGRGVRRTVLQSALAARAAVLGVVRVPGRVTAITNTADAVVATVTSSSGGATALSARFLIGADGLHSSVARIAGLALAGRHRRWGVRRHWHVAPWSTTVDVHWIPGGEVYVTPVADDAGPLVQVAVLGGRGLRLDDAVAGIPVLADRLTSVEPADDARGAGPFGSRVRAVADGRVLLAGDAAGYDDAITGEGVGLGIAQADAAVAAIVSRDDPDAVAADYARAVRRSGRPQRRLTRALAAASDSPLHGAIAPAARLLPSVFGAAVETLAR